MKFDVVEVSDKQDGGAVMTFDMDRETLVAFAKIGLLKVLTDEAERVIREHEEVK